MEIYLKNMHNYMLIYLLLSLDIVMCKEISRINIGALVESEELGNFFKMTVSNLNDLKIEGIHFDSIYSIIHNNPMVTSNNICDYIIPKQIVAVIIASEITDNFSLSSMATTFTCGFYEITTISLGNRESSLNDKSTYPYFMRTVAPYSSQTKVWINLLMFYEFKQVIFIISEENENKHILSRFKELAFENDIKIESIIELNNHAKKNDLKLRNFQMLNSRVIIFSASSDCANWMLPLCKTYNLTGSNYAWIINDQTMSSKHIFTGTLSAQFQTKSSRQRIKDAVSIIGKAVITTLRDNLTLSDPPNLCGSKRDYVWKDGKVFRRYLKKSKLIRIPDEDNDVMFDDNGNLATPKYVIYNSFTGAGRVGFKEVGRYSELDGLQMQKSQVIWPGGGKIKPSGIHINSHLKVVTLASIPFLYTSDEFSEYAICPDDKIPCRNKSVTSLAENEYSCCYGYLVEMLTNISRELSFTFEMHLVKDGQFGTYEHRDGSKKKIWNGLIKDLLDGYSDLILAPLTISPDRSQFIGFTKPFKYQGITILVKKTSKGSSLASFLQPLQNSLWIFVGMTVFVVAVCLYLLDHFSPFAQVKAYTMDTYEVPLTLYSATWFAWGVLLNSGIGNGTPKSFSSRILGMVWAGFAMIVISAYTANLAAFLVLDRRVNTLTGLEDSRLKNPQENYKFATVTNSSVAMYFKRHAELNSMYRNMVPINYATPSKAIHDIREGEKLKAFIWDSSRLDFEESSTCDLATVGEVFGKNGYGIGMMKHSPWLNKISMQILKFHDHGFMQYLDTKYISSKQVECEEKVNSPAILGLVNMAGAFMLVAGGILAGVVVVVGELCYSKNMDLKIREMNLARNSVNKWRSNIEKRKILRNTLIVL